MEEADLPEAYASLLALRARGVPDTEVAAVLDVPVEALPILDEIAGRKLSNGADGAANQ